MSKKSLLVMGLTALCGAGLVWAAEPQARGPRPSREERLKQELGLTDVQIDQLQSLRLEERKASIRRRADRELLRIDLIELLKADAVDEKAVRAKAKQMADLEAQGTLARAERGLALRKIVSAEQAEKLMRAMHRQRGPRPAHRGPSGHYGPDGARGPAVGDMGDQDEPDDMDAPAEFAAEADQR
jgi:Spy/CpxP family protein refolding chaperone